VEVQRLKKETSAGIQDLRPCRHNRPRAAAPRVGSRGSASAAWPLRGNWRPQPDQAVPSCPLPDPARAAPCPSRAEVGSRGHGSREKPVSPSRTPRWPPSRPSTRRFAINPLLRVKRFAAVPCASRTERSAWFSATTSAIAAASSRRGVAQLEIFCQQLQNLISTARLWAETQQRERDATLLVEVTRRLSSTLDLEQVLDIITESALSGDELDVTGLYRWDSGVRRSWSSCAAVTSPRP